MSRHIIHFHIPALPIAVARISRPELRDRPVVIAPPQSERALILSASHEARSEGVFKGMPLGRAVKLCPELKVLHPDPRATEKACHNVAMAAARYTPVWEPSRPGHIYLDLTGTKRLWGETKDAACCLMREIHDRLYLSGTVGVASNKMVSNIASRIMPSEGVLDVNHGQEASFMAPLKVDVIPGIGRIRRRTLMEELNIILIRQLAAMDMGRLRLIFGGQASLIHQRALGIDPRPVYPSPKTPAVGEEITLPRDENDDSRLLASLYRLVEQCSYRMRKRGLFPRKAGLLIRYSDQMESGRQTRLPHLSLLDTDLYPPLERLFLRACNRRVRVRFIRVWFCEFSPPNPQLTLFHAPSPDEDKKSGVTMALDQIRDRYGEEAIR